MNVIAFHNVQGLLAGEGLEQAVALRGKINFQRVDNVRLIVTDKDVVHIHSLRFYTLPLL